MPEAQPSEEHEPQPDERELRALLERAVPRLPLTEASMRGVRQRIARYRRRRRAAVAGAVTVVAGLVLSGTLLSGTQDNRDSVPAASHSAALSQRAQDQRLVRFAGLSGLTLRLPARWQTLDAGNIGFASSQDLRLTCPDGGVVSFAGTSPKANEPSCPPVGALRPGGVLLVLRSNPNRPATPPPFFPPVSGNSGRPSADCRAIHGSYEYSVGLATTHALLSLTACVHGDDPALLSDTRRIIEGAAVGSLPSDGPTRAGTPTSTPSIGFAPSPSSSSTRQMLFSSPPPGIS